MDGVYCVYFLVWLKLYGYGLYVFKYYQFLYIFFDKKVKVQYFLIDVVLNIVNCLVWLKLY